MQRFSIFHRSPEEALKAWHQPYADVFLGCAPVLDVGCGLGYFADLLRDRGVECIGLDIDPAMVAASEARGHVAHLGDQRSLGQLGVKFGGIHISHVIEHLWGDDVVELLESCAANLRDGGRIIIRTPNWEVAQVRHKVFWLDHTHRRPYPVELITRILGEMDFTIEAAGSEPYGLQDSFVVAAKGSQPGPGSARPDYSHQLPPPISKPRALLRWIKNCLKAFLRLFGVGRNQSGI